MPIIDGKVQIPGWGKVAKSLVVDHKAAELPRLKRSELGLSEKGPKGEFVEAGNQWPEEAIHPLFPEFQNLSGVEKAASISHYAHGEPSKGRFGTHWVNLE